MPEYVYLATLQMGSSAPHKHSVHETEQLALMWLNEETRFDPFQADLTGRRTGNQHRLTRLRFSHKFDGRWYHQYVRKLEVNELD